MYTRWTYKFSLVILSFVSLCGCVTTYVQPNAGDIAQMHIKPTILISRNFQLHLYQNPLTCTDPMTIASGSGPANPINTKLQAGVLNTLSFRAQQANLACRQFFSFTPILGRRYQLNLLADSEKCHVELLDITAAASPKQVESLVYRSRGTPGSSGSTDCLPINEATKPASSKMTLDDFKNLLPAK